MSQEDAQDAHLSLMGRALILAQGVLGTTSPNPAVGAVLVKDGELVGEGATSPPGGPHAERLALQAAGDNARGATLYVTLEPCRHHGRTSPCSDALIAAGVREVHLAVLDPNPGARGGIEQLQSAGIPVVVGEFEKEAAQLNEAFFKWVTCQVPFVYGKFAASLDGKIATPTGQSRWITSETARAYGNRLRSIVDAVMIGVNTAIWDDPQLTAREPTPSGARPARQPLRVIVDSRGRTPPTSRLFQEPGLSLVAVTEAAPLEARKAFEVAGAEVLVVPEVNKRVDVYALLKVLGQRQITSVLAEGGGELLGSLFAGGLVDKVLAFLAPAIIGGKSSPTSVAGVGAQRMEQVLRLRDVAVERLGDDLLVSGYT